MKRNVWAATTAWSISLKHLLNEFVDKRENFDVQLGR